MRQPHARWHRSARTTLRVVWRPITIGTIGTPGRTCARNGSCISSECSRPCAEGISTIASDASLIRLAISWSTCIGTERRFPRAVGPDRDALEGNKVRRPHEHDRRGSRTACRVVGVRADRAGVHEACMRRDNRARRRVRRDIHARKMRLQLRDETLRIVGIPACRRRRRA